MANCKRSLDDILEELGEDFDEFRLRVRRGEPTCSVFLSADNCVVLKTCRDPDELADLVQEASDELVVAVEESRERVERAKEALAAQREPDEVDEDEDWDLDEDEREVVAALEEEVAALRRQVAAYKATVTRLKR